MRKIKLLIAACALILGAGQTWAQTDVTSTYITNADFSSTDGWTAYVSASFKDYGNGLIGTYGVRTVEGQAVSTADATHLATEYCFGFEVRWSTSYAAYQQTTGELPSGHYELSFDVENTNSKTTSATYENLFFVKIGDNQFTDTKKEWMSAKSSWTTHTITFDITAASTATISLGYGTGSNNIGSTNTPTLHVSHLKLTWTDILQAAKDALQAEIDKAKLCDAKEGLASAISTAEGVLASATTEAELEDALAALQAADKDAVLRYENGLADATYSEPVVTSFVVNGTFDNGITPWQRTGTYQNNQTANNKQGAFTGNFYENWHGSAQANKMYQTINNIPNGTYRLDIAAFVNTLADPNESQYVFANSDKTYLTTGDPTAYEVYTVVTNNQIEIGLEQTTATANWMGIDNVSLRYYGAGDVINDAKNASHKLAWEEAKAAAEDAIANSDYANVTGSEKTALQTEIAKAEPATADGYDDAAEALNNATSAFTAAKASYDALVTEIAYAKTIGVTTADDYAATSASTAVTVTAATQDLKENEYTSLLTSYSNDVSSFLDEWTKGNYDTTSGQSYEGGSESYFDKWSASAADLTSTKTVELPAGKYVVRVAGRGVSSTTMNLSVKVGDADAVSTPFLMNGDTGKGIDTNGATNFDESGTYSNGNVGRGWQYRYITFTTAATGEVTITINGHLNDNTWQSFYAPVLMCDDDTYASIAIDAAKAELQTVIDAAPAVRTANIGDGVFQYAAAGVTAYSDAKTAAQDAHDAGNATRESIAAAKTTFEAAIEAYNALEINAPADGQLFNVVLTYGGWTYDQKAMTYMAGDRSDMGGYNIKYQAEANQNLAQAFTFTKVSGNNYKMSQIDAASAIRYISTGVPYGGSESQIRTTTEADDALEITVIPTATNGVWNLYNTAAKQYIGSQDAGVYTVNSHIDFNIVETTMPSITINTTDAKWGTVILPFAQVLPDGVKAYSCAEVSGTTLTLVEVTDLEANKPYIIEGVWNAIVTDNAQGTALTYTDGLLTGVYKTTAAINDTYILQKQDETVGFFKVNTETAQPNVPANRAYLTTPAGARPAAFFFDGEATAINAINALTAGQAEIYDVNGVKQNKLQKGMNIIRTNGKTMKVMVK